MSRNWNDRAVTMSADWNELFRWDEYYEETV